MRSRRTLRWPVWLAAGAALFLASCSQILLQPTDNQRNFGPLSSSESLNPNLLYTPTPPNQQFPGLTPVGFGSVTPVPTPNPVVTPKSYVKEHQYADLENNGQPALVIIAGDRRPSPPPTPTPVLQHQKGDYMGNFVYNLEIWNWNPNTNQYSLSATWPSDPSKRYIDMRYHLLDLIGDGTQQILVQARLEGVSEALDYAVLRSVKGQLLPIFAQSNLEHGQVRLIGKNLWQEQSVRGPNEDPCCPTRYKDDAFVWTGAQFSPESQFAFPTPANFPPATPTPLSARATPMPLDAVSVPVPAR